MANKVNGATQRRVASRAPAKEWPQMDNANRGNGGGGGHIQRSSQQGLSLDTTTIVTNGSTTNPTVNDEEEQEDEEEVKPLGKSSSTSLPSSLRSPTTAIRASHSLPTSLSGSPSTPYLDRFTDEGKMNLISSGLPEEDEFLRHRNNQGPYCPSYSVVFKCFLLVRALAATMASISHADEVFNSWEPMHYLQYGSGLQTWEYSVQSATRSWAFILLYAVPAEMTRLAMSANRLQLFFIMRILLGAVSAHCEATFYRSIVDHVDPRIGRYVLLALLGSAGTWISSNSFSLYTFTMYTTMLFFSQMLQPPDLLSPRRRIFVTSFWLGLGTIVGWPISFVLGIPFVAEEVLIHNREQTRKKSVRFIDWRRLRVQELVFAGWSVLFLILIPVLVIDYYYFGRIVLVLWNVIKESIIGKENAALDLQAAIIRTSNNQIHGNDFGFGSFQASTSSSFSSSSSSSAAFYLLNGLLNFNIVFVAALISLPMVSLTWLLAPANWFPNPPSATEPLNQPGLLFMFKLLPMYIWIGVLSLQSRQEEAYFFVAFPLICFNAAVGFYFGQKIIQRGLNFLVRPRPKNTVLHQYCAALVWILLILSTCISLLRIMAIKDHFSAPNEVYRHAFELVKVPQLLTDDHLPTSPRLAVQEVLRAGGIITGAVGSGDINKLYTNPALVFAYNQRKEPVRVCVGKEWHRFQSHYFLPEGARLGILNGNHNYKYHGSPLRGKKSSHDHCDPDKVPIPVPAEFLEQWQEGAATTTTTTRAARNLKDLTKTMEGVSAVTATTSAAVKEADESLAESFTATITPSSVNNDKESSSSSTLSSTLSVAEAVTTTTTTAPAPVSQPAKKRSSTKQGGGSRANSGRGKKKMVPKTHNFFDWRWSSDRRPGTSFVPLWTKNLDNTDLSEFYTPLEECDYLIDLQFSSNRLMMKEEQEQGPEQGEEDPNYLQDVETWEKLYCHKYLDTESDAGRYLWVRSFWMPEEFVKALTRGQSKNWGEYCLAVRKKDHWHSHNHHRHTSQY